MTTDETVDLLRVNRHTRRDLGRSQELVKPAKVCRPSG